MAKIERDPRREPALDGTAEDRASKIGKAERTQKRIPVGSKRNVLSLSLKDDENWHVCIVNENLLHEYKAGGYQFVRADGTEIDDYETTPLDACWRIQTGYDRNAGRGTFSYAMKIPMELYKEDMAMRQKEEDDKVAQVTGKWLNEDKDNYGKVTTVRE